MKRTGRLQRDPEQQPEHEDEEQALSEAMIKQNIREQDRIKTQRNNLKTMSNNKRRLGTSVVYTVLNERLEVSEYNNCA